MVKNDKWNGFIYLTFNHMNYNSFNLRCYYCHILKDEVNDALSLKSWNKFMFPRSPKMFTASDFFIDISQCIEWWFVFCSLNIDLYFYWWCEICGSEFCVSQRNLRIGKMRIETLRIILNYFISINCNFIFFKTF